MTEQNEQNAQPVGDPEHGSRHIIRCIEISAGEAKTGNDQVGCRFEIVDGKFKGQIYTEYLSLSDKAMEWTIGKLRALGWNDDIMKLDTAKTQNAIATFNREPVMATQDNPHPTPGSYNVRIGWINPMGVVMAKVHDAVGLAKLQTKIKAVAARMGSPNGQPTTTNAPPAARKAATEDDFWGDGGPSDRDAPPDRGARR